MVPDRECPNCGAPLAADAPEGLCPRCLLLAPSRESSAERGDEAGPSEWKGGKALEAFLAGRLASLDRAPTAESGESALAGLQFGPYRIVRLLGEGGMGVVFLAEQEHPVLRRVALKLIRPGMDTREVIARFETERQAWP